MRKTIRSQAAIAAHLATEVSRVRWVRKKHSAAVLDLLNEAIAALELAAEVLGIDSAHTPIKPKKAKPRSGNRSWLSTTEVAKRLRVSEVTLLAMVERGVIAPDADHAGWIFWFRRESLPRIEAALRAAGLLAVDNHPEDSPNGVATTCLG